MERFFDIIFSSFALIVLSPLLIPIIFLLKVTGEGEIFFLQERIGKDGKIFKLIKFATMLKNSPNIGTGTITMKGDPRILTIGKYLRKTKLNELPQLINIFLGHMSVVGPRPLTDQTFKLYKPATQEIIKNVRPGLSGVASIIFRNEEEIMSGPSASIDFYSNIIAPYKGSLEEWFVSNKGLNIYFISILLTVFVILFPSSKLPWRLFKNLPHPPAELKEPLNFI